jgi:hypothetical protein
MNIMDDGIRALEIQPEVFIRRPAKFPAHLRGNIET